MRALIAYYSLTGTTRTVALTLATALSAEVEEIRCGSYRPGPLGFCKAGYDSWADRLPPIERPVRDVSRYDLVLVGGPMWAWRAATPVRAYLTREAGRLGRLGLFLTLGGAPADAAFAEMERLAGKPGVPRLALRQADVASGAFAIALEDFAAKLRPASDRAAAPLRAPAL